MWIISRTDCIRMPSNVRCVSILNSFISYVCLASQAADAINEIFSTHAITKTQIFNKIYQREPFVKCFTTFIQNWNLMSIIDKCRQRSKIIFIGQGFIVHFHKSDIQLIRFIIDVLELLQCFGASFTFWFIWMAESVFCVFVLPVGWCPCVYVFESVYDRCERNTSGIWFQLSFVQIKYNITKNEWKKSCGFLGFMVGNNSIGSI